MDFSSSKIKLLMIIIFLISGAINLVSAYQTYPIVISSLDDFPFNHFSYIFWGSLVITLVSLFLLSNLFTDKKSRYVFAFLFVFFFWIFYLCFPSVAGSDSDHFRGMTTRFMSSGLDSDKLYFDFPSFFILSAFLSLVLNMDVNTVSSVVFVLIGFLFSSTLFIYFSKKSSELALIGVVLYFLGAFYFINYQFAPQSFALVFFLLLIIVLRKDSINFKILSLIFFISLLFTHPFIVVYYLLFIFIVSIKKREYRFTFFLYFTTYIFVFSFFQNGFYSLISGISLNIFAGTEYGNIVQMANSGSVSILDNLSTIISRLVTLVVWLILGFGFLVRTKLKLTSKKELSLFLSSFILFGLGSFIGILGSRTIQFLFIPIIVTYIWVLNKYKLLSKVFILLIILLSVFTLIHSTYVDGVFPTNSGERACNFLADKHLNEAYYENVLASRVSSWYLMGLLPDIATGIQEVGSIGNINDTKLLKNRLYSPNPSLFIINNILLEKELITSNVINETELLQYQNNLLYNFNRVYDDGYSIIFSPKR